MPAKRVIACLDVMDGRVVKGVHFQNIRDAGDPVDLAARYSDEGADEIVFLDITATHEGRSTMADLVAQTASRVFVPLTVGGGISSREEARRLLRSGADKVAVNSAAVSRPELINEISAEFGVQATVVAIDAKREGEDWTVYVRGGRESSGLYVLDWAREAVARGAGEILLTSMDADGAQAGFDIPLTAAVREAVNVPVIASGGAGSPQDFVRLFHATDADAALAASIFHYDSCSIASVKKALLEAEIAVRPT